MFNSSPITSWEGAEAIFSYADSPLGMARMLLDHDSYADRPFGCVL